MDRRMEVRFLGCGDAFGSGGRFNTCFLVTGAGTRFLIDCGASSMVAINRFGVDANGIDMILLTHLHGDHFGGLPFFLLHADHVVKRDKPLLVVGPRTTEQRLTAATEALFPGSSTKQRRFELVVEEYELEREWSRGPVSVLAFRANHYSGEGPSCALRVTCEGKTVAYSGDGAWSEGLLKAASGVDLFIAEAYYFDRTVGGHMDLQTLKAHLADIGARRLVLTHMSDDMLGRLGGLEFDAAEDGKTIAL
jgi:ribonuclease BN (tRNA processing enzyme)